MFFFKMNWGIFPHRFLIVVVPNSSFTAIKYAAILYCSTPIYWSIRMRRTPSLQITTILICLTRWNIYGITYLGNLQSAMGPTERIMVFVSKRATNTEISLTSCKLPMWATNGRVRLWTLVDRYGWIFLRTSVLLWNNLKNVFFSSIQNLISHLNSSLFGIDPSIMLGYRSFSD